MNITIYYDDDGIKTISWPKNWPVPRIGEYIITSEGYEAEVQSIAWDPEKTEIVINTNI